MSILALFEPIKKLLKLEKVAIDNVVFRLHYKVTVATFLMFTVLITAKQFFGDPINCHVETLPASIVNVYCWVHGTFTIPEFLTDPTGSSHPGVGTHNSMKHAKIQHLYYQWVCFMVFGQAILFYLPRHIWKNMEAGRVKYIVDGAGGYMEEEEQVHKAAEGLALRFKVHRGYNTNYAFRFFLCELLNLVNVVFQIMITDKFLGGRFMNYGHRYMQMVNTEYNEFDEANPVLEVFPKVTKCNFGVHGPTGDITHVDAMCVLPLNVVNEKVYLIMWLWMMFLTTITVIALIYRTIIVVVPSIRCVVLCHLIHGVDLHLIRMICSHIDVGDWFVLRQMSKNVNKQVYNTFMINLAKELRMKDDNDNRSSLDDVEMGKKGRDLDLVQMRDDEQDSQTIRL